MILDFLVKPQNGVFAFFLVFLTSAKKVFSRGFGCALRELRPLRPPLGPERQSRREGLPPSRRRAGSRVAVAALDVGERGRVRVDLRDEAGGAGAGPGLVALALALASGHFGGGGRGGGLARLRVAAGCDGDGDGQVFVLASEERHGVRSPSPMACQEAHPWFQNTIEMCKMQLSVSDPEVPSEEVSLEDKNL